MMWRKRRSSVGHTACAKEWSDGGGEEGHKIFSLMLNLIWFPNPLAPGSDIQIHVSWETRLVEPNTNGRTDFW